MLRVALRGVGAHVMQFALSVLAVLLGVAFVAGTFSLRAMLADTFGAIVATTIQGDAYLRGGQPSASADDIGEDRDARTPVPLSLIETVEDVDGVRQVLPDLGGPLVLVGADGTAVANGQAPSFGVGLDPQDPGARVVTGRIPAAAGEIALEGATARTSGLEVGDRTTAVIAGTVTPVVVVGEVDLGAPSAGATLVFIDAGTARDVYAPDGRVPTIAVYAEDGVAEADLVERLTSALDTGPGAEAGVQVVTGEEARADARDSINRVLGFIGTFLLVFAGISLFVGTFIIANTFAMSVRQRQREFALLRALGAAPSQVFASVLVQAAVVGLVGSALGVLAGIGLVSVLRGILGRMGMNLSGAIPVEPATVAVSIALGALVSVLAAFVPARRAALVPPVEAMRAEVATEDRTLRLRAVVGAVLLAVGVTGVLLATTDRVDGAGTWLGVGAGAVLLAVLLLAPALARTALRALAQPFVAGVRPLGRLAQGNVTRNPRRTANTAGALLIGMALVGATTVLAATAQASTRTIVENESTADLIVQSADRRVPEGAVDAIRALPTVARADVTTEGAVEVTGPGDDGPAGARIVGLSDGAAGATLEVNVVAGSLADLGNGVAVQRSRAESEGWSLGDTLTLRSDTGHAEVEVRAIIDSRLLDAPLVVSEDALGELLPVAERDVTAVLVAGAEGMDREELRADLAAAVAPFVILSVQTNEELATSLADQVGRVLVILYALLALSVIIAVLGIVNTLALAVIERTREIGLLRAVGLGRLQLAGTIAIESVLTAVFGTTVGVAVGVSLASAMPFVFDDVGLSTLAVPWRPLGGMLVLAVVVGLVAAVWPGTRAARLPVLRAIAHE